MSEQKVQCEAGEHHYDPSKYSRCPYCRGTEVAVQPGGGEADADAAATTPEPVASPTPEQAAGGERKTVLQWARRSRPSAASPVADADEAGAEQAAVAPPAEAFDQPPVVGWLIIVAGPGAGRDLHLYPGMNWIGREPSMDIALDFGDSGVSARDHAVLIYDVECNGYFIKHEHGRNLTYLNEKRATSETRLKAYDRIRIHDTELLFLPLCGKRFEWG